MFFAIISTAQWTLAIIQDIPERPKPVPTCVSTLLNLFEQENPNYNSYYYSNSDDFSYGYSYPGYNSCDLVSTNPEYDLTAAFVPLKAPYQTLKLKYQEISQLESEKNNSQSRQRNSQQDYNTSLSERTAGESNPLYNNQQIRNDITTTRDILANLEAQIQQIKSDIDTLKRQYAPQVSTLKNQSEIAQSGYYRANLMYRMFVAILSLFFAGAVFIILYRLYVRRKIENSPHTIIFSVATFAYGLVLLQIFFMFLWDIIPHTFLDWLLGIISLFTPLLYLVQFLWPVIIVAVFGYLVYRIQKRLYSPSNVLKRFVMDKKCPNCGNAVDMTKPFCPLCSHEIHLHCPHCHELTMKGMPFCSNCGTELPKENEVIKATNPIQIGIDTMKSADYTGVIFYLENNTSFVSRRENIIKLALYVEEKLAKNTFAPGEFLPLMENILSKMDKK